MPPYICADCGRKLEMSQTGVVALELTEGGRPYQIYRYDAWECPECHIQILAGHGRAVGKHDKKFYELIKQVEVSFK